MSVSPFGWLIMAIHAFAWVNIKAPTQASQPLSSWAFPQQMCKHNHICAAMLSALSWAFGRDDRVFDFFLEKMASFFLQKAWHFTFACAIAL